MTRLTRWLSRLWAAPESLCEQRLKAWFPAEAAQRYQPPPCGATEARAVPSAGSPTQTKPSVTVSAEMVAVKVASRRAEPLSRRALLLYVHVAVDVGSDGV